MLDRHDCKTYRQIIKGAIISSNASYPWNRACAAHGMIFIFAPAMDLFFSKAEFKTRMPGKYNAQELFLSVNYSNTFLFEVLVIYQTASETKD